MDKHQYLESLHIKRNNIRDLILGGQDGLVNVLGIVFGVSTAGGSIHVILAAGLAATFAEAVSMGAVAYTSALSAQDYYLKVLSQERNEIDIVPENEKNEIREIYRTKGLSGKLLDDVVDQLTKDKASWAEIMTDEEHNLKPVETKDVLRSSFVVGASTIGGSLIPILPYLILHSHQAIYFTFILSAISLFSIGYYQAKSYVGNPLKKGMQMLLIGLGATIIGFAVGKIFNTTV